MENHDHSIYRVISALLDGTLPPFYMTVMEDHLSVGRLIGQNIWHLKINGIGRSLRSQTMNKYKYDKQKCLKSHPQVASSV